eukprot:15068427-Alexandrium_andersonii.AAC.1
MVFSDAHVCMQDRRAREGAGTPTLPHRAAVQLGSPPLSLPPHLGRRLGMSGELMERTVPGNAQARRQK